MTDQPDIRNRIVAVEKMRLASLLANVRNFRTHPGQQRETLNAVFRAVGWVGAVLAYHSERNGGALTMLDGHLRQEEAPELEVPVLITDLSDAEADLVLATYDPLSALAGMDPTKLDSLLRDVETTETSIQSLLDSLAERAGLYLDDPANAGDAPPDDFPEYGEDIDHEFQCPKCNYRWSGKPK